MTYPTGYAERNEARDLARALWDALVEASDDYAAIGEADSRLEFERLPNWLTDEPHGPEHWEHGGADDKTGTES